MIPINRTFAPLQALIDELVRCGARRAVSSPGSRNAPLALILASDTRLETVSVLDERAAGFTALGMAKATRLPVIVTCTSGTAAANLLPAVVEAHHARVPLIVLTADRPPELRGVGAGQAIDQVDIFGGAAKWFVEVGEHEPSRATAVHHRALGARAFWTAVGGRRGPVHLNLGLREPLDPAPEALDVEDWAGRPNGAPWVSLREHRPAPDANDVHEVAERITAARRGVLVCGEVADEGVPTAAARLAVAAGWTVLAEATSGVRRGEHDRSHVIAGYDVLLRDADFAQRMAPELVLRIGDMPTSKPLRGWLAGAPQIVVDPDGAWHDPTRSAELMLHAEPAATLDALAANLEMLAPDAARDWVEGWRAADALVGAAVAAAPQPSEPRVYAAAARAVPADGIGWIASSMPIRDVESFLESGVPGPPLLSNRGANGIDGTLASAGGAALALKRPCVVAIGELALAHDIGGLLAARRLGADLRIVCVDNGGGGIFDFLPVAASADRDAFETHIATPHCLNLAVAAQLAELDHVIAETEQQVVDALAGGPVLVEVRSPRALNVDAHRAIFAAVHSALPD